MSKSVAVDTEDFVLVDGKFVSNDLEAWATSEGLDPSLVLRDGLTVDIRARSPHVIRGFMLTEGSAEHRQFSAEVSTLPPHLVTA